MRCIENGTLQAYLDDELTRDEKKTVMQHLESCPSCREELEMLQALDLELDLSLQDSSLEVDVDEAWRTFEKKINVKGQKEESANQPTSNETEPVKHKGVSKMTAKTKRLVASGVAAATIFGSLAFPQVQVAADQFLSMFRVNQVEMVKLTQEDMHEVDRWLSQEKEGTYDLKGLGEIKISDLTQDFNGYSEHARFSNVEEVKAAGYEVETINDYNFEGMHLSPGYELGFNLDVDKANNLLTQFGVDEQFDKRLDGETFSLHVGERKEYNFSNDSGNISYSKVDAPTFTVPEGASVDELKDTLLELPFVPNDVKRQIQQIQSIEETLPLPYVQDEGETLDEITIAGEKGFMVTGQQHSLIMWQKGDQIHVLETYTVHKQDGTEARVESNELQSIANELAQ